VDISELFRHFEETIASKARAAGIFRHRGDRGVALADNSLESLQGNWSELNSAIHDVNFFTNIVAVLGAGLLFMEKIDWSLGMIGPLLDTDEFVELVLTNQKRAAQGEPEPDVQLRLSKEEVGPNTFGRFFVYLLMMLERLKLSAPDLGQYVDPSLPITIHRES